MIRTYQFPVRRLASVSHVTLIKMGIVKKEQRTKNKAQKTKKNKESKNKRTKTNKQTYKQKENNNQ